MDWRWIHQVQNIRVNFQREEPPVVQLKMIFANLISKAELFALAKRLFPLGSHCLTLSKYTRKSSSESTKNSRSSARATPTALSPNGNTVCSPPCHQGPKTQRRKHRSNSQKYSLTTQWLQMPQNQTRRARLHCPKTEIKRFCSQPKWKWNSSIQLGNWRCFCAKWSSNNKISIMIQDW